MLFKFFGKKHKKEDFLVLDIGTTCTKVYYLNIPGTDSNEKEKFFVKDHLVLENECEIFDKDFLENLEKIKKIIEAKNEINEIKYIVFVVSGRHSFGKGNYFLYERKNPQRRIDNDEMNDILEIASKKVFVRPIGSIFKFRADEFDVINTIVTDLEIDHEKSESIVGKQGKVVKIGIYNSFASKEILELFERIADVLNSEIESIVPSGFSIFKVLDQSSITEKEKKDYLLINMGFSSSEVTLIKNGLVLENWSIEIGTKDLENAMSSSLDVNSGIIHSLILGSGGKGMKHYQNKKIVESISESFLNTILSAIETYLEEIEDLEKVKINKNITLYFYGGFSETWLFQKSIEKSKMVNYGFKSVVLFPKNVNLGLKFDGRKIFSTLDTSSIAAMSFFCNFLMDRNESEK